MAEGPYRTHTDWTRHLSLSLPPSNYSQHDLTGINQSCPSAPPLRTLETTFR